MRFFPEFEDISTGSAPPIDGDFRPSAWLGFPNGRRLKTEKGVFLNGTRVVSIVAENESQESNAWFGRDGLAMGNRGVEKE